MVNTKGREAIKASALARSLSKKRLTELYGEYVVPSDSSSTTVRHQYNRKPLQTKSPEREKLYEEYKNLMEQRRGQIDLLKNQKEDRIQEIKELYGQKRKELTMQIHSRTMKTRLRRILKVQEQQAIEKTRADSQVSMKKIRVANPFHNWNGFLKWQANQGNKTALDVLRSRQQAVDPSVKEKTEDYYETRRQIRQQGLEDQKKILATTPQWKTRDRLMAINQMKQLAVLEGLRNRSGTGGHTVQFSGVRHTIDNNGIVIFKLAEGGTIRDTGKKLYFSNDGNTRDAALIFGQMRFGKRIQIKDNVIEQKPYGKNKRNQERDRARDYQPVLAGIKEICEHGLRRLSQLNVVRFGKRGKVFLPDNACRDLER